MREILNSAERVSSRLDMIRDYVCLVDDEALYAAGLPVRTCEQIRRRDTRVAWWAHRQGEDTHVWTCAPAEYGAGCPFCDPGGPEPVALVETPADLRLAAVEFVPLDDDQQESVDWLAELEAELASIPHTG